MTLKKNVLVVANLTAASDELCNALVDLCRPQPAVVTLLVPATKAEGGRDAAREQLEEALQRLRDAGLEAEGSVGDSDPFVAVSEAWDPRRYDEIVVSTLPTAVSRWLHAGLPERIFKLTGVPVHHVVSEPPRPARKGSPARPPHEKGALGPLSVLAWGAPHDEHDPAHSRRE